MTNAQKRVLIVEDFEDSRTGLSKLLAIEGYAVLEAADGAQAIDLAFNCKPDIILMDLSLPVVDGLTAARTIKNNRETSAVPIIALTAHESDDIQEMIEAVDFADFVAKPVNFASLVDVLSRCLNDGSNRPSQC